MSRRVRLRYLLRERDDRGGEGELVLSVYREYGVVPKASRDDNFNKTPQDLSLYKRVGAGELVVNKMKAWQGSLGVSDHDGAVSGDYLVCRVTSPEVDRRYLHQLLRSAPMIEQYRRRSTGIRPSQWRLYWDDFCDIEVELPPLPEQRTIADYLDAETARIDALIAKKQQLIHLLEERVNSLVFQGISGKLTSADARTRDSGLDWLGTIPSHFGTPTIGANFATQLGKMLNAEAAAGPNQYRYVKNTNIKWDSFDLSDLPTMAFDAGDRTRCELLAGDLLVCEGGEVGRSAIWPGSDEPIYFQKALHRVRPLRDANTRFLMYCLWAAASLDVFSVEGNQATIVHLTGEKLREHRFPWPPKPEQDEIVRQIDEGRSRITALQQRLKAQLDLVIEHRQALITAAVTGDLAISGGQRS